MSTSATLKYPWYEYTPEALESGVLSESEIRAEYMRLRKIANQRLEVLGRRGYEDTQTYLRNAGTYRPQSEYTTSELMYQLYRVSKFVTAKSSSYSGMKQIERETKEKLLAHGLKIKDLAEFGNFMEFARSKYGASEYDSERVAELYQEAKKRRISVTEIKKDFDFWVNNVEGVQELPVYKNAERRTSDWYRKKLLEM